jgi:ppGpp synthetase/RelA/SpoT-type nucleotidyltranferase
MTSQFNLPEEHELVDQLVELFRFRRNLVTGLLAQVASMIDSEMVEGARLHALVHSTKGRVKDEYNLRDKLLRKLREGREKIQPYEVTKENFFRKVNDLAAFRIMHLHPRQMEQLHPLLLDLFKERKFVLAEDPAARVWDLETERFYRDVVGLRVVHTTEKLYSSVHYVLLARADTPNPYTCEVQVRTLADEVWGEVDHRINYPERINSIACREQIKSLAHVTTSCNRLVDSIFASHAEWSNKETS